MSYFYLLFYYYQDVLLSPGLDPNADVEDTTLLIEAIVAKNLEIVKLLLEKGKSIYQGIYVQNLS